MIVQLSYGRYYVIGIIWHICFCFRWFFQYNCLTFSWLWLNFCVLAHNNTICRTRMELANSHLYNIQLFTTTCSAWHDFQILIPLTSMDMIIYTFIDGLVKICVLYIFSLLVSLIPCQVLHDWWWESLSGIYDVNIRRKCCWAIKSRGNFKWLSIFYSTLSFIPLLKYHVSRAIKISHFRRLVLGLAIFVVYLKSFVGLWPEDKKERLAIECACKNKE